MTDDARSFTSRRALLRALAAGSAGMLIGARGGFAMPTALRRGPRNAGSLLIRRGDVVNADGTRRADVRIVGGRITEVARGLRANGSEQVIDAKGHLVLPGGIDPHTHVLPPFAEDLTTGSQAALAGGITTIGTFSFPEQGQSLGAALDADSAPVATMAIAGIILHSTPWPPTPEVIAQLGEIAERGQPSLKLYMVRADFHAQLANVIKLLEGARAAGLVTMIHCEDEPLLSAAVRRLEAAQRTSLANYAASRPVVGETAATELAASLCDSTRAPMHVVHLSSAPSLEAIRRAKHAGLPLTVETRPLYLHLTEEKMQGSDAPLFVGQPPLRSRADSEALWAGLVDGSIDILATDHAPWKREQKLDPSLDIRKLRPGVSDLQFMLPMYFSEGVRKRKIPLERFVATTSATAARIFGLDHERGAVRVGYAADVTLWDPDLRRRVRAEDDLSQSDYSVYEGWDVTGWPVTTIRGGDIVYENGKVVAAAGSGALVRRRPRVAT